MVRDIMIVGAGGWGREAAWTLDRINAREMTWNILGFADDDPKLLVHDYIKEHTPYIDVIKAKYPNEFKPTVGSKKSRIDYVYCTQPLFDRITFANVIWDEYTTPVRDPQGLSNFWRPSDHLPILIDFNMK